MQADTQHIESLRIKMREIKAEFDARDRDCVNLMSQYRDMHNEREDARTRLAEAVNEVNLALDAWVGVEPESLETQEK